jgi:hypothetical protein
MQIGIDCRVAPRVLLIDRVSFSLLLFFFSLPHPTVRCTVRMHLVKIRSSRHALTRDHGLIMPDG